MLKKVSLKTVSSSERQLCCSWFQSSFWHIMVIMVYSQRYCTSTKIKYLGLSLKIESCHDADFVVTVATGGFLWCHQRQQSWHHNDFKFLVAYFVFIRCNMNSVKKFVTWFRKLEYNYVSDIRTCIYITTVLTEVMAYHLSLWLFLWLWCQCSICGIHNDNWLMLTTLKYWPI